MKPAFKDDRFHRFIWFDPISKDPKIINPRRVAKLCEDLHATVLHYAATAPLTGRTYYPSKYRPLERTLKPGDDYLRDIVHECHKRNIKLVAYFNCHWMSEDNLPEGSNWIVTKPDGKVNKSEGYGSGGVAPCVNSPVFVEQSKNILREITANYDIDGIFYDGPTIPPGTCYCDSCKKLFRDKYNADIPVTPAWGDPLWTAWVDFRFESIARYFRETSGAAKAVRDITCYKNAFALCPSWFSAINIEYDTEMQDIMGGEHFVFYSKPLNTPVFGGSMTSKHYRATARGRVPAATYGCYSHKVWDYYTLPTADMKQIIAEIASNGVYPFVTVDDYTSVSDPQNFEAVRDMYGFIEKNEKYYKMQPWQNVALFWSQTTADLYSRGELAGSGGTHHFEVTSEREYEFEVKGFYEILTQAHIPFDIITEAGIEGGDLARYKCLVMPNTACLNDTQAAVIREFVRNGGTLVSSHEVSLYKPDGTNREDFLLKDVLGVTTGGVEDLGDIGKLITKSRWDYLTPIASSHAAFDDVGKKKFIPLPILSIAVKAEKGAKTLAALMEKLPGRYLAFKSTAPTANPAIVENRFGKGRSYYFAGTFGEQFYSFNIRDARNMVNSIIRSCVDVAVELKNEPSVDLALAREGGTTVLHLINWAARVKRPVEKIYPISDLVVTFRGVGPVKKVRALMAKKYLKPKKTAGGFTVTVPRLDGYEVLVLEA